MTKYERFKLAVRRARKAVAVAVAALVVAGLNHLGVNVVNEDVQEIVDWAIVLGAVYFTPNEHREAVKEVLEDE